MAQHTIIENIHRNTEDWFAVKAAVRGKGVDCPDDTPTANVAEKIEEIETYKNDLINLVERDITDITIPAGTTKLGEYIFCGCTHLANVNIPVGVTEIGPRAFFTCIDLSSVVLPDGVTTIGDDAFATTGLRSIVIPKSVTLIKANAFGDDIFLQDVYYTGTEEEWDAVTIQSPPGNLDKHKVHFNYVPE